MKVIKRERKACVLHCTAVQTSTSTSMESATLATGTGSEDFVKEQLSIQRGNLLGICRMCVKSLVDKAAFETITDSCPHLQNFCNIMEHILSYRLQSMMHILKNLSGLI